MQFGDQLDSANSRLKRSNFSAVMYSKQQQLFIYRAFQERYHMKDKSKNEIFLGYAASTVARLVSGRYAFEMTALLLYAGDGC